MISKRANQTQVFLSVLSSPSVPLEEDPFKKFLWIRITAHLNINEPNLANKPEEKSSQRYGQPFHRLKFYERWNHTGSRKGEADVRTCACALRHKCHKTAVSSEGTFGTVHTLLNDMRKEMRKAKFFSNTCLAPKHPLAKQSKYESTWAGFEDTRTSDTFSQALFQVCTSWNNR